eukprot:m.17581 g.17581  ORF g.17581 m.17581 type:complete len:315 (+) comp27518_c0_seq1:500-1444(+)
MATKFADLSVTLDEDDWSSFNKTLKNLKDFGFHSAAISRNIELLKTKTLIPPSPDKDTVSSWAKESGLTLYTRLTVILTDDSQLHTLAQDVVRSYNILAFQPTTEKTFFKACGSLNGDIICLDFTQRFPFYVKPSQVRQAIRRGIHFEIVYSPMILDATARRNTISGALELIRFTKGKNIVLSSGSCKPMDVRGPYDVINLGLLFGLKEAMAKRSVLDNCRAAILHSKMRTETAKGVTSVQRIGDLKVGEGWVVKRLADDGKCGSKEEEDASDDDDNKSGVSEEESDGSEDASISSNSEGRPAKKPRLSKTSSV